MAITNTGSEPDRLVTGSTSVTKKFEIHKMGMDQNVMKMRPLLNGIEIDPGKTVTFEPGGYHVRFVDLNRPRKQGEKVPATPEFAKAGRLQVEFLVEGIGATHDGEAADNAEPIPEMGH